MEWLIGLGVFVLVVSIVVSEVKARKKRAELIDTLKRDGFYENYRMYGNPYVVLVDKSNQMFAFVGVNESRKIRFNQIISWQHTYTEQNKTVNGVHRHSLVNNKLEFTVNDPDVPLIQVAVNNYEFAKHWSARFSALLQV
ncbi:hypothetical protein BCU90_00600 [Vibrio lentus]|uniref:Uncharacterized protein n=1 Tax=Vibrio kanaloae TaxID=170673 RepID=A0A4U1YPZ7_9VIBR|nr:MULTISPECIES: hypothetical protein [Vibrio]NOJ07374.1 hypothetical protein [Vibrio splendidus]PMG49156.1 hypothetical protein BCU90_00600 [Vibrio lentus]PTP67367.1 hypothetical protein CWO31_06880 [Vibrio splendidus]TKF23234.1 hypothetical protein FCV52_18415 [Vibrio kanaloae]